MRRSVRAVMSIATIWPLVEPIAASTLLSRNAASMSPAVTLSAVMRSGLSHTRMAKLPLPRISARCTPGMVASLGSTVRTR